MLKAQRARRLNGARTEAGAVEDVRAAAQECGLVRRQDRLEADGAVAALGGCRLGRAQVRALARDARGH
eukprot:5749280-Pleurochrysis_carterae.AAC.1